MTSEASPHKGVEWKLLYCHAWLYLCVYVSIYVSSVCLPISNVPVKRMIEKATADSKIEEGKPDAQVYENRLHS